MNPTPSNPSTVSTINAQTPGPLECATEKGGELCTQRGFSLWTQNGECVAERRPQTPDTPREPMEANARLLAASYTAFDKAGRALGVDAAELAERIDLAGVIRALYESSRALTELDALAERHNAALIDDALQTLPRLSS